MPPWRELPFQQEKPDQAVVPNDFPSPTTLRALQQLNDSAKGTDTNLMLPDLSIDETAPSGEVTTERLIKTNSGTDTVLTVHKNPSRPGENVLNTNLVIIQSNGGVVVYEPAGAGRVDVMGVDKDGDIGRYLIVGNIEDIRLELEQQEHFSVNWSKDRGGNASFYFENYQHFNLRKQ